MKKTVKKSCLTAGVAALTAATIAFVPSVAQPTPHPIATPAASVHVASPAIELTAGVQPLSAAALPRLLSDWLQTIIVPPSAGLPVPTPDLSAGPVATSIDSAIKNTYNAVEPWVRYGFELATYAVGWVPVVGWLAPQIMIFYNLGERITHSITFNVADFLGGQVSFVQGLTNVGRDTVDSFVLFARDEFHFFLPNIPLPPLPPIANGVAALTTQKVTASAGDDVTAQVEADKTETNTPTPTITRPFTGGRLAHLVHGITARDGDTTTTDVQGVEGQGVAGQGVTVQPKNEQQSRPRPHGLVGSVGSAIRHLISSAPHPLRDRAVAPKPAKEPAAATG